MTTGGSEQGVEQVDGRGGDTVDARAVEGAAPARSGVVEGGSEVVDLGSQGRGDGAVAPGAQVGGDAEDVDDVGLRVGSPGDESGGLEADGERELVRQPLGSRESSDGPLSGRGDIAPGKKRARKNAADQRHFPFDA